MGWDVTPAERRMDNEALDIGSHLLAQVDRRNERNRRRMKNYTRRLQDASLREMCGTSARTARLDMGL